MLTTVMVASQQNNLLAVWSGSTLGMAVADGIAIVVGKSLGMKLLEKLIKYSAAAIFCLSGTATLFAALMPK
jgi:putative Ca2+/H+ antiporter (TMEM165/GDT1 family)